MIKWNKADLKIAKEFFKKYTTGAEVSRHLYPNSCNHYTKSNNVGSVTRALDKFKDVGYIEEKIDVVRKKSSKGIGYTQRTTYFRLNLKPFFEIANKKIKEFRLEKEKKWKGFGQEAKNTKERKAVREVLSSLKEKNLNKTEKKFLNYIFNIPKVREMVCQRENLFDGFVSTLEKIFFYNQLGSNDALVMTFIQGFLSEDKRHIKKEKDRFKQFRAFTNKIDEFLSELMCKIREFSGYDPQDQAEIAFNTKLKNYIDIPYDIYENDPKEVQEYLLKRFETGFYEKRSLSANEHWKMRSKIKSTSKKEEAF